jgi:hypothetical protein
VKPQDRLVAIVGIILVFIAASFIVGTDNVGLVVRGAVRVASVENTLAPNANDGLNTDSSGNGIANTTVSSTTKTAPSAAVRPSQTTTATTQTTIPIVDVEEDAIEIPDYVNAPSVKRYAIMNVSSLVSAAQLDSFQLTLPFSGGSKTFSLIREELETDSQSGNFTWEGYVNGDPLSSVVMVQHNGLLALNIARGATSNPALAYGYTVMPFSPGKGIALESDQSGKPFAFDFPLSYDESYVTSLPDAEATTPEVGEMGRSDASLGETTLSFAAASYEGDVMVVFTKKAMKVYGPTPAYIQTVIALAGAQTNLALKKSQANFRINIVHSYNTPTFSEDKTGVDLLSCLSASACGMNEVENKRFYYGADFVVLLADVPFANYCGIAWVTDGHDAQTGGNFYKKLNAVVNVNINDLGCGDPDSMSLVFAHELGHNFGMQHDKSNASTVPLTGASYGYKHNSDPYFRTIMSYDCPDNYCPHINYYSTPDISVVINGATQQLGSSTAENAKNFDYLIYQGQVKKWGSALESAVNTSNNPPSAPLPPAIVTATDGHFSDKVDVDWEDAANSTQYKVYRKPLYSGTNGVWSYLGSTTKTKYTDKSPAVDTVYEYRVIALNSSGSSIPSENDTGYRVTPLGAPLPPRNPEATFSSGLMVDLKWGASPSPGITAYELFFGDTPNAQACDPADLITTLGNVNSQAIGPFNVSGLYRLSIRAKSANGTGQCADFTLAPSTPTLSGSLLSNGDVSLSWTTVGPVDHFVVRKFVEGWNQPTLTTVPSTQTSYIDTSPSTKKYNEYYVYAVYLDNTGKSLDGKWSDRYLIISVAAPSFNLKANTAPGSVNVSGYYNGNKNDYYYIYYNQTGAACTGSSVWTNSSNQDVSFLNAGEAYYFSMKACNWSACSVCSTVKSVQTN